MDKGLMSWESLEEFRVEETRVLVAGRSRCGSGGQVGEAQRGADAMHV